MSRVPLLIALVVSMAMFVPALSQAEDGKIHLAKTPIGPTENRFFFSAPIKDGANTCKTDVRDEAGLGTAANGFYTYATNAKEDPCRQRSVADDDININSHKGSILTSGKKHTVYFVPATEELALDKTKKVSGLLVIMADRVSTFKPVITLQGVTKDADGKDVVTDVGQWAAATQDDPQVDDTVVSTYNNRHEFPFEFDAPEKVVGKIRIVVNLLLETAEVRSVSAIGYRIGVWDVEQSYIDLPVTSVTGGAVPEPELYTCQDGSQVENATLCPEASPSPSPTPTANETDGPEATPEPTNTTSAPNNTTTPKEKGLPGFGLVAVLTASFIAAVVLRRRRE